MYTTYFGLTEKPFSLTPDPRFLYLSERHAEALAHLQYGILEGGGFVQLTGEVGTGKTTLTRSLLARLPEEIELALILNPRLGVRELLLTICEELGVERAAEAPDNKTLIDRLNRRLIDVHTRGHRAVLVIDEAQNLDIDVLEQLRLLTNLETDTAKLLQIILIGQPELRTTLARNDLRQLAQRITGRYHLGPLEANDTAAYVRHRLAVAGAQREIFTPRALAEVHRRAHGIPRLINVISDRALLGAYTVERAQVTPRLVGEAALEVSGELPRAAWLRPALAGGSALALVLLLAFAGWSFAHRDERAGDADTVALGPVEAVVPAATAEIPATSPHLARTATPSEPALPDDPQSFDELMRSARGATGTDASFATLLGLWQVEPAPPDVLPCRHAARNGLRCEHQLGSWTLLRSLNRPAILALVDSGGEPHQAVLIALEGDRATFQIGGTPHVFLAHEVDPFWFGEFLVLWQPQPGAEQLMLPGSRGESVRWLRETLTGLQGGPDGSSDPALYDDALLQRVRAFQRSHGLKADGKAGLQTLIALGTVLGEADTPLLRTGG